jgi:hypothetical protein
MGISIFGQDNDERRYRGLHSEGDERKHYGFRCVQGCLLDDGTYLDTSQKLVPE